MATKTDMEKMIEFLEEDFSRRPLKASVVIQALQENEGEDEKDELPVSGNEQYMKIKVNLPENLTEVLNSSRENTQVILVADRSGSMSGNPWSQVKQALLDLVADSVGNENLHVDIITYNMTAEHVKYTPANYRDVIGRINSTGQTNFNAAFLKVDEVIGAGRGFTKVVILFLTDGHDTSSYSGTGEKMISEWKKRLGTVQAEVIVHTVGFSSGHDYNFLQKLSQVGTMQGMLRYCEAGDGPTALKAKLQELFEFVSVSSGTAELQIKIDGDNRIVGLGVIEREASIQGEITEEEREGASSGRNSLSISAESWIYLKDAKSLPKLNITFIKTFKKDKNSHELKIAVTVDSIEREMITTAVGKIEWGMRILHRNTDILTTKFADTIAKKGDLGKLSSRLNRLQTRLSKSNIFGLGVTKEMKSVLLDYIKEIQAKIDMMHSMMARYLRGETDSVSMLARAHDLRYEAKFSKNRRQRLMDTRVSKNMSKAKADQSKLKTLTVSQSEIDRLSQDATDFYFCALSMNSIKDILLNGDETENAIGFGLAVKRPEHALDEPTATRIQIISGTLVSRTSMFDALEYKISVDGHLHAHGGFEFSDPLGCATVGTSREPINAWLPLYINKSHWERVKVLLKPTLGYFCTLDPLGYDFKQMDVLFMVLGSMIGQLNDVSVGEHQLRLLFSLQRLCAAAVFDYELLGQITSVIKNFIENPEGRTKDVIPNLCTLIGYIVAMPTSVTRPLLGYETKEPIKKLPEKARKFWLSLTTEILRRAGGSMFREASEARLQGVIDHLLHTRGSRTPEVTKENTLAQLVQECSCLQGQQTSEIKVKVADFDPAAEVKAPEVELRHCSQIDKAMDLWAQAKCGVVKNKNRDEQVAKAKKVVLQWINEGRQQVGVPAEGATATVEGATKSCDQGEEETKATVDTFDEDPDASMIELIAKLLERLSRASFPHISSIPGFIAFVHHWLSCNRTYVAMDERGGLAPEEWVSGVKEAVVGAYTRMNEFQHNCEAKMAAAKKSHHLDSDTLIVKVTDEQLRTGSTETTREVSSGEATLEAKSEGVGGIDHNPNFPDDNSDDAYYDYDDEDDDGDHEAVVRRRKEATKRYVSLPMVLREVDQDMNQVTYIRAALVQAVEFYSNSKARAAAKEGKLRDLSNTENGVLTLKDFNVSIEQRKVSAYKMVLDKVLWQRANFSMLKADTVWAFIGYLMNTYKDRDEGFSMLLTDLTSGGIAASLPHLEGKLRVILFGKWEDCDVLANGNMWLPEKKFCQKFEALVGAEIWAQIEVDMHSNVQIHVYRESDIPNRHGHCNSTPYIPNVLREKLGMALLPAGQATSRKRFREKRGLR